MNKDYEPIWITMYNTDLDKLSWGVLAGIKRRLEQQEQTDIVKYELDSVKKQIETLRNQFAKDFNKRIKSI